jgi:hypothetical protein
MFPIPNSIAVNLPTQDDALRRACEIANSDEELVAIERKVDLVGEDIAEPWVMTLAVLPR